MVRYNLKKDIFASLNKRESQQLFSENRVIFNLLLHLQQIKTERGIWPAIAELK